MKDLVANKIIYTILGFAIAFAFFPHTVKDRATNPIVSGASTEAVDNSIKVAPELALNLTAPILTAKSAVAYDLDSGTILYSKNLDEKLPIASLTKLMTALVIVQQTDLNAIVTIGKQDQTIIGSTTGLAIGEKISVGNLFKAMLISSSNDAALTLANFVGGDVEKFAILMNDRAVRLGLTATHFSNAVGWDSDDNYSNTLDLLKIVSEFLKNKDLADIVATKETIATSVDGKYEHKITTTNQLLLENPEVIGIKTGFTSKALGNLIILADHNDRRIITVVLGSENRENDTQKLLDWLFAVYKW